METQRIPRIAIVLTVAAAFIIVMAGVRSIGGIVGPTFLALVLTITVHPLRRRLRNVGLPEVLTSAIMLITAYLVLGVLGFAIFISIGRVAALVPEYNDAFAARVDSLGDWLDSLGVDATQVSTLVSALDPGRVIGVVTDIFSGAVGLLSGLVFIATLLLFMAIDTTKVTLVLTAVRSHHAPVVDALVSFADGTRSYMRVSALFGLIVAVVDIFALWLLGIPGALVWGVLAFVTNFIPNIGFVIGVIPPALFGLLEGGWDLMLAVIVVYSVINFVIQSIIQPKFVGDAVGLTTTVSLIALVFWSWLIGPLGALLAVPLTLLVRALLIEADPGARWSLPLLSGRVDDEPEVTRTG